MLGLNPEGRTQNSLSNYGEVLERGGREGGTEGRKGGKEEGREGRKVKHVM